MTYSVFTANLFSKERRLAAELVGLAKPRHMAIIIDTWKPRQANPIAIYRLLSWCEDFGIGVVTLWLRSRDGEPQNVRDSHRKACEAMLCVNPRWSLRFIDPADGRTRGGRMVVDQPPGEAGSMAVNIFMAYDGHRDVVASLARVLSRYDDNGKNPSDVAECITIDEIGKELYLGDFPDPDLIIRTTDEHRLDGFLLWQNKYAEFWFGARKRSSLRKVDLVSALLDYGRRDRRYGR